jgi:hypothetical protein
MKLAIWLVVLLAVLVSSAQASRRVNPVKTYRGSLQLTASASPQCLDMLHAGYCYFETPARVKVNSAPECRARDVKISRVDAAAGGGAHLVNTPGTNRRGIRKTTLGGTYTAWYPGTAVNDPVFNPIGGTKIAFSAVSPGFKTFHGNNPLKPVRCKKLRSTVEEVTVPMPPPPPE